MHLVFLVFLAFSQMTESFRRPWSITQLRTVKLDTYRSSMISMADTRVPSFVQDELRPYAMKLHTKDQAREGQQQAQIPFTKWQPTRAQYLQFLVDSLAVYDTLEEAVVGHPELSVLERTGLERSAALKKDIQWMCEYDKTLSVPTCGEAGQAYTAVLKKMLHENVPGFVCHYYNQYFAHTAGGLRIGQSVADKLLEGKKLHFYSYEAAASRINLASGDSSSLEGGGAHVVSMSAGDHQHLQPHHQHEHEHAHHPTEHGIHDHSMQSAASPAVTPRSTGSDSNEQAYIALLKEELRRRIDLVAQHWSPEQREACCKETINCFKYGGALLAYLNINNNSGGGSGNTSSSSSNSSVVNGDKSVVTGVGAGGGSVDHKG